MTNIAEFRKTGRWIGTYFGTDYIITPALRNTGIYLEQLLINLVTGMEEWHQVDEIGEGLQNIREEEVLVEAETADPVTNGRRRIIL